MEPSDRSSDYYRMRKAHQVALADQAESERIRQIHLELAERYQQVIDEIERDSEQSPGPGPAGAA